MVLHDVRNEFVSVGAARRDYGVVLATNPLRVEEDATQATRARMRAARNWDGPPAISWEPLVLTQVADVP
jgi:hypothetical protein